MSLDGAPLLSYPILSWKLRRRFKLRKIGDPIKTLDLRMQDYELEGLRLIFGWDNWSGFWVTAEKPESEPLVEKIEDHLRIRYG